MDMYPQGLPLLPSILLLTLEGQVGNITMAHIYGPVLIAGAIDLNEVPGFGLSLLAGDQGRSQKQGHIGLPPSQPEAQQCPSHPRATQENHKQ